MKLNAFEIVTVVTAVAVASAAPAQAAFVTGDLAVVRVNDAVSSTVDTAASVFIDVYSPNGVGGYTLTPHSLLLSGGSPFTLSRNNQMHDGILRQSSDGQYLTIAGYNAALGSATFSAASSVAPRVVARIDSTFAANTSTVLTGDYDGAVVTSAASKDGSGFWLAGGSTTVTATGADITTTATGGLRYVPFAGTSGTHIDQKVTANGAVITDSQRSVLIADGQLYITTPSSTTYGGRGLFAVGTGLPTGGTQLATAPITNTASSGIGGSPLDDDGTGKAWPKTDCVLLDLSAAIPGLDTAYSTGGKKDYQKWLKDGNGVWQNVFQKSATFGDINALTAAVNNGVVTLFAATSTGVYQMADTVGYSTSTTPAFNNTALFTPATGTQFRGIVSLVPEPTSLAMLGLVGAALIRRKR